MLRGPNKLRVLLYQFFPGGGIGRYTHELATELWKQDLIDVEVACAREYEFSSSAQYPVWPGLASIRGNNRLMRRCRFLMAQVVSPVQLLRHARRSEVDVIHFSNVNHLTFPAWSRSLRNLSCAVVATAHDVRRAKAIVNRRWEERALRSFYAQCDGLFVHSESQGADLSEFAEVPAGRVHLVPHGPYCFGSPRADVATLRANYGIPLHRTAVLAFGAIRDDKNLQETLSGIAMLSERPFVLIAGRGGAGGHLPTQFYKDFVHALGMNDDVRFIDRFIDDEEIPDLFSLCDAVLLTYKTCFTSQSGVLSVAVCYRKPVVVTPSPTMREAVERFGLGVVCSSDRAEAIADGVRELQARSSTCFRDNFALYELQSSWARNARIAIDVYQAVSTCKRPFAQAGLPAEEP